LHFHVARSFSPDCVRFAFTFLLRWFSPLHVVVSVRFWFLRCWFLFTALPFTHSTFCRLLRLVLTVGFCLVGCAIAPHPTPFVVLLWFYRSYTSVCTSRFGCYSGPVLPLPHTTVLPAYLAHTSSVTRFYTATMRLDYRISSRLVLFPDHLLVSPPLHFLLLFPLHFSRLVLPRSAFSSTAFCSLPVCSTVPWFYSSGFTPYRLPPTGYSSLPVSSPRSVLRLFTVLYSTVTRGYTTYGFKVAILSQLRSPLRSFYFGLVTFGLRWTGWAWHAVITGSGLRFTSRSPFTLRSDCCSQLRCTGYYTFTRTLRLPTRSPVVARSRLFWFIARFTLRSLAFGWFYRFGSYVYYRLNITTLHRSRLPFALRRVHYTVRLPHRFPLRWFTFILRSRVYLDRFGWLPVRCRRCSTRVIPRPTTAFCGLLRFVHYSVAVNLLSVGLVLNGLRIRYAVVYAFVLLVYLLLPTRFSALVWLFACRLQFPYAYRFVLHRCALPTRLPV